MNLANHFHAIWTLLAILFACVITFMFLYNKRSRDQQKKLESRGLHFDSKEEAILEAQDAMRQERREHHRH